MKKQLTKNEIEEKINKHYSLLHVKYGYGCRAVFDDCDLSGYDFTGLDLRYAYFRRANLTNAKFDHSNLVGADFRGAILEGTSFENAKISEDETVF